ncbi:sigma-54 interaction domain-containing protein [Ferrimonas balearica]|uniref:sigma-54 interaction domain-containing protein n=1 Tax=Ferrimonas balearica TaxID=44012 RepID=UPI001F2E1688|nr:sigma 54-interacting transcriptional regulator [Ferrimonas balearica]MBY6093972.1 sigma 54-interacting transcriptional regulator [Ferrimonas balearica]
MATLISWLGKADIDHMKLDHNAALASIALKSATPFDRIIIFGSAWEEDWEPYKAWLRKRLAVANRPFQDITIQRASLTSPIHYPSIARFTQRQLHKALEQDSHLTISLTSGTPAMITMAVLLGKSIGSCRFVQSSEKHGVEEVDIPVDFAAEYQRSSLQALQTSAAGMPKLDKAFDKITARSRVMQDVVDRAQRLALTDALVLVLGETGTGKELMAQAIHAASPRATKPFRAVNCGALPENLVDSILFGHVKGAFTGADKEHQGLFEQADGGTLFLDEVGELPLLVQVKLLRALQQREITKVGAMQSEQVDVRIIAATHRDLFEMVATGDFREDLFYRLAVGIIELPALRERRDDLPELLSLLLEEINQQLTTHPQMSRKHLSEDAINFALEQVWPGNIRELWSTLHRAALWANTPEVTAENLQAAQLKRPRQSADALSLDSIQLPQDIQQVIDTIKKSAIEKALTQTGGNKTQAAKLLGLANHQTLANWMKSVGLMPSQSDR